MKSDVYANFAKAVSHICGRPLVFITAALIVIVWAVTGPLFGFSDTWQLVINTGTTVVTFLMVFIIQHTQNRDTEAMQVKLDELIRATQGAQNALLCLEDLDEKTFEEFRKRYQALAREARAHLQERAEHTSPGA